MAALPGIERDPLAGDASVGGRGAAHRLPARGGIAGGVPEFPPARLGGRGDPLLALRHGDLPGGPFDAVAHRLERPPEPPGQLGVGMDLGHRSPLLRQLDERRVAVELAAARTTRENSSTNVRRS